MLVGTCVFSSLFQLLGGLPLLIQLPYMSVNVSTYQDYILPRFLSLDIKCARFGMQLIVFVTQPFLECRQFCLLRVRCCLNLIRLSYKFLSVI